MARELRISGSVGNVGTQLRTACNCGGKCKRREPQSGTREASVDGIDAPAPDALAKALAAKPRPREEVIAETLRAGIAPATAQPAPTKTEYVASPDTNAAIRAAREPR